MARRGGTRGEKRHAGEMGGGAAVCGGMTRFVPALAPLLLALLVGCDDTPTPPAPTTPATPTPAAAPAPTPEPTSAAEAEAAGGSEAEAAAGEGRKTCLQPKTAWCLVFDVDRMTDDDRESCTMLGGTLSDGACPTENAIGRCRFEAEEGMGEVERVYYATPRDPLMVDEGAPRTYTAAMAERECEEDGGGEWSAP